MTSLSYTDPVAGVDLNSVADAEVSTALSVIETWANGNIDGSNISLAAAYLALKPQSVSGNTSASTGVLYRVTATATITLPGHSAGQVVGVINVGGTTTVSGTAIQGIGLSGATSFLLGTPGAAAILVDDGTNWNVVAGQQDTGWVALSLATNFGAFSGGYTPSCRLQGDIVRLRGEIQNNTGGNTTVGQQWATVPSGFRPTAAVAGVQTASTGTSPFAVTVNTAGVLAVGTLIGNSLGVFLDGLSYSIS